MIATVTAHLTFALDVLPPVAGVPDLCVGPIGALCAPDRLGGGIGAGIGGIGQAATGAAMAGIGGMFVDGARDASTAVLAALDASTRVDLTADWFRANTAVLAAVTLPVVVALFVLQVISAVLRREPGGLARAVVGVGKAVLGSALAVAVTQSALLACDEIADAIATAAGTTVTDAARRFLALTYLAGPTTGPALQILLGLAVIIGSFLLWAVLLFRKAALLLVAVFAPVAFAGATFDHTRGWVRRWIEVVAALVFCKVVIVVVFVIGLSAFGNGSTDATVGANSAGGSRQSALPSGSAGLSDLLVGLMLLGIAAFAPWLSWRFVHFAGSEVTEAMHATMARSPLPAVTRGAGRTARQVAVATAARPIVGAATSGMGGIGARSAPVGRGTIPTMPASPAPATPGPASGARGLAGAATAPRAERRGGGRP
jgi:hypothetical protein